MWIKTTDALKIAIGNKCKMAKKGINKIPKVHSSVQTKDSYIFLYVLLLLKSKLLSTAKLWRSCGGNLDSFWM